VGIIERFKADSIVAAPRDGQLIYQSQSPDQCVEVSGEAERPRIRITREYKVPAPYTFDRLHQLLDQPATAGGWHPEPDAPRDNPHLSFCRPIGPQRRAVASISTTDTTYFLTVQADVYADTCEWTRRPSFTPPS
jgi:hypothetical protein